MTTEEREQFASVIVSSDGQSWLVDVAGKVIDGNPFRDIPWVERVAIINAAFNARVDAEAKKAVEEFRKHCLDIILGDCYGMVTDEREAHHNADIEAIAEKVRALPTEPGKGE